FHTWLPDAAASALPGDVVLMSGVMNKVGTFAMIRGQADLRRLIVYLSVSGMALITLDIFAMTSQSQAGAALQMVNHGFLVGALFLITGFLSERRRSPRIAGYGGSRRTAPALAGLFLAACLAGLALPGLNTFVSEFLVLTGTFTWYPVAAGFRHHQDHPVLDLHAVDLPAHDDRPGPARSLRHARPARPRAVGRRAADRPDHRSRHLPQAGPGHHQPRSAPDPDPGAFHRPGAAASGRRASARFAIPRAR
ncbi:MAG: proton-conducting transporter membrane subunit, partial [Streptosporangiaceae bacterium]